MALHRQVDLDLITSVSHGDTKGVLDLLAAGANVNARITMHMKRDEIWTPIHKAAHFGDVAVVHILVNAGADVNTLGPDKQTLLHALARSRDSDLDLFKSLIEKGLNPEATDKDGRTPLLHAASAGRADLCALLLSSGASPSAGDRRRHTPLHKAALHGHQAVCDLLIQAGARNDAVSLEMGHTPLHMAAQRGRIATCVSLLAAGADPLMTDLQGHTAVHLAADAGQVGVIGLLCTGNVDPAVAKIPEGVCLPKVQLPQISSDRVLPPLHLAAAKGRTHAVAELLQLGANPNGCDGRGSTALHAAAYGGHHKACRTLLAAGADPNATTSSGFTPLHSVASGAAVDDKPPTWSGHEVAALLIASGASVNALDRSGRTPLHHAASNGAMALSLALLKSGADPTIISKGVTAWGAAGRGKHPELATQIKAMEQSRRARKVMDMITAGARP